MSEVENRDKDTTFDYETFFSNFHLPKARHDRRIKESEPLKNKVERNGKVWTVVKIEYTTCSCGHHIKARDDKRGETVCEGCGVVSGRSKILDDDELDCSHSPEELHSVKGHTDEEVEFIAQTKNRRLKQANMQNWRKSQYAREVGVLNTFLHMTQHQKDTIKLILNTYSLKLIHGNANYQQIIAGVCRYILEKAGRARELRYNREPFILVNLNEKIYRVIKYNLDNLGDFS
jgi:hypothetical protein